ncbi:RICIN domain-containing protein [Pedobacter sp. CCM 8938]|uniref:RICIN domain-containing protein n=1 Tax=Pedobacter fastidiosus TaxID=2765361 RepID=A0ABR7KYU8_9SPHI|nr:RICIN domain-containing protein [Pedobacter fastidiosus]MBC6112868.1 RICIN domain-containing protein [Pedobacter fastidiosus]
MKKSLLIFSFILLMASLVQAQIIKGNYAIKNVQTGMLLRVKDASGKNGTPLVAYDPQNWKCMTWDFKNVDGNTYQLLNLFTSKTFQPKKDPEMLANLEEQPLVIGDTNQQYEFIAVGKAYLIKLKGTELFLTPEDKKGSTNSNIILAKKTNTKDQYWTIYEQSPTM